MHLSRYLDSGNNVFIKDTDFVECLPETHVKIRFLNSPMRNIHNLYLNSIDQDSLIRVTLVT